MHSTPDGDLPQLRKPDLILSAAKSLQDSGSFATPPPCCSENRQPGVLTGGWANFLRRNGERNAFFVVRQADLELDRPAREFLSPGHRFLLRVKCPHEIVIRVHCPRPRLQFWRCLRIEVADKYLGVLRSD